MQFFLTDALLNGDTIESHIENRRREREYREDQEAYEQRSMAAAAIICATISPAAESFVKGHQQEKIAIVCLRSLRSLGRDS